MHPYPSRHLEGQNSAFLAFSIQRVVLSRFTPSLKAPRWSIGLAPSVVRSWTGRRAAARTVRELGVDRRPRGCTSRRERAFLFAPDRARPRGSSSKSDRVHENGVIAFAGLAEGERASGLAPRRHVDLDPTHFGAFAWLANERWCQETHRSGSVLACKLRTTSIRTSGARCCAAAARGRRRPAVDRLRASRHCPDRSRRRVAATPASSSPQPS